MFGPNAMAGKRAVGRRTTKGGVMYIGISLLGLILLIILLVILF
jgi:hypothetical protein